MSHRFADVADALADEGIVLHALPFVLNVDDQQDVLRGGTLRDFAVVHAAAPTTMLEHRERLGASLCIVRAFVPHVSEQSTSWLTRPVWTGDTARDRERS